MKNPYPNEKFSAAISSLATGTGSIQARVRDAFVFYLIHLKPEELPESIRYDFEEFTAKFASVEPEGDEGSAAASTNQMSDEEASELARKIEYMADIVATNLIEG